MCTLTDYSVRKRTYKFYVNPAIKLRQRKKMELNQYLNEVKQFALPTALNREYLSLGLAGEAGEVASLVAKAVRDNEGVVNPASLAKELGDVMWFVVMLCAYYGIKPNDILTSNVEKLASRQARGVIGGSGDER